MAPGFNRPPYLVFDYPFILSLVFSFFFLYNLKEIFSKKKLLVRKNSVPRIF